MSYNCLSKSHSKQEQQKSENSPAEPLFSSSLIHVLRQGLAKVLRCQRWTKDTVQSHEPAKLDYLHLKF